MSFDHFYDQGTDCRGIHPRPAPRCYARKATSKVASQSRFDADGGAIVTLLSIITGAMAFLVVYGAGSF